MWNRPVHGEHLLSITDQKAAKRAKKAEKAKDKKKKEEDHDDSLHAFERRFSTIRDQETDVEEVSSKYSFFSISESNTGSGVVRRLPLWYDFYYDSPANPLTCIPSNHADDRRWWRIW
jgi:hypothetical protein